MHQTFKSTNPSPPFLIEFVTHKTLCRPNTIPSYFNLIIPWSIFSNRFRKKQDEYVAGISRSARVLRKRKNLVSTRCNLMNWLLETLSLILLIVGAGERIFLNLLYLLVNSCGTPLVILLCSTYFHFIFTIFFLIYFLGIEENRRLVREHFQSRMRIFKRNNDKMAPNKENEA